MSRFTRPAGWLRQLFTPSQTESPNPGLLSDDVSLVQPYDGGGYPTFAPGQWGVKVVSVTAATGEIPLLTTASNELARLLCLSATLVAGVAAKCTAVVDTGGPSGVIECAEEVTTPAAGQILVPLAIPIMGPSHILSGNHSGGDAATIIHWRLYFCVAPLGSVFYV